MGEEKGKKRRQRNEQSVETEGKKCGIRKRNKGEWMEREKVKEKWRKKKEEYEEEEKKKKEGEEECDTRRFTSNKKYKMDKKIVNS